MKCRVCCVLRQNQNNNKTFPQKCCAYQIEIATVYW